MLRWLIAGLLLISFSATATENLKVKHSWVVIIDQMPKAHLIYSGTEMISKLLRDGYKDAETKIECRFTLSSSPRGHAESIKSSCNLGTDYRVQQAALYCSDKQSSNDTYFEVIFKDKSELTVEIHCR